MDGTTDHDRTSRRLAAIDTLALVDGPPDAVFARAARLASALLGAAVTHTTLVLEERQYYPSHVGLPAEVAAAGGTPLSYSFCRHVVDDEAPVVFEDTHEHARLEDNQAVAQFAVRTYVGVPLRAPDGTVVGTVCALDFAPRAWTDEEVALLEDVAAGLHSELVLRREVDRLRHLRQQGLTAGLVGVALAEEAARLRTAPGDAATAAAVADTVATLAGRLASPT